MNRRSSDVARGPSLTVLGHGSFFSGFRMSANRASQPNGSAGGAALHFSEAWLWICHIASICAWLAACGRCATSRPAKSCGQRPIHPRSTPPDRRSTGRKEPWARFRDYSGGLVPNPSTTVSVTRFLSPRDCLQRLAQPRRMASRGMVWGICTSDRSLAAAYSGKDMKAAENNHAKITLLRRNQKSSY
jgi:hypothetical protein